MIAQFLRQINNALFGPPAVSAITAQLQKTVKRLDEAATDHLTEADASRKSAAALIAKADGHVAESKRARNVAYNLNELLS